MTIDADTSPKPGANDASAIGPSLYVDLDGTLIQSDLLIESAVGLVKADPASLWCVPGWLAQGRPMLKRQLAERAMPEASELPYRPEVLAYLREQRDQGRQLILATAADCPAAERVAEHLGLFDDVLATDGQTNLKGKAKLEAIRKHADGQPFAYMGDSSADEPIWAEADERLMAGGNEKLYQRVTSDGGACRAFEMQGPAWGALLAGMRPRQWVKNGLLLVPMLAGHAVTAGNLLSVFWGIVCFCLAASSIYLVNDTLDVHADRTHPTKSRRPIASGRLPIPTAIAAVPVLMGTALLFAAVFLPIEFLGWLVAYLVVTVLYSTTLRSRLLLDVITLAGLYALRIFAGGAVVQITPSFWLLTLSIFLFLSLGFLKRYAELRNMADEAATQPGEPARHTERGYLPEDRGLIQLMGVVSGYAGAVILCLYLNDPISKELYAKPAMLWPVVPLFVYWVSRIWLIAQRGHMNEDPVAWAVGDRVSWALVFGVMLLAMLASG
ncbi:UbiA family prenyltransferase [Algisphaera agarilytica]|uniref:4-hydroxybenzoate polyprenyltransferase n=1 Tax=Algisphaera agarilytica TaxID=1385975 RepID=A0A7X0H7M1_9BACT|nr:UbiA family prenyltransferase [Algisphaera agarilytica]MBB6430782.1 4-hydroxybenzoate polyprenyltransferase [Algisphaera agarilytica]